MVDGCGPLLVGGWFPLLHTVYDTRLAARRLRRRAGPPSYRVILRSGICCQLSLIAVNNIIQPAPEKLLSFDTPVPGKVT